MSRKSQPDLFSDAPIDYRKPLNPARTAMRRKNPSPIARALRETGFLAAHRVRTVLDYGCGVGRDVEYYRELGLQAEGYDPHEPFGWSSLPTGCYDLVTNLFVFNVIADAVERLELARILTERTRPLGHLVIAARSPAAIDAEARKKAWTPFGDGYLSSPSRATFQKGMLAAELRSYFGSATLVAIPAAFGVSPEVSCIVLQRSEAESSGVRVP